MAWDSTMRKPCENKSDDQIARVILSCFENGNTRDGTKYSIGGMYVRPMVSYVSKNALAAIGKGSDVFVPNVGVRYFKLQVKKMGVTREHMIPIRETYMHLKSQYNKKRLTAKYLRRLMPKLCIAIITKEEDEKLSSNGYSRKMPAGWSMSGNFHPLDRYRAAGLTDDIWVREFLDENLLPRYI